MSRGYNARKKARRQQAQAVSRALPPGQFAFRGRPPIFPILLITGAFAATAIVGFAAGGGARGTQVNQDVADLLAGIPQRGNTLGSSDAPMTLMIFGDLECPTMMLFAENYLPSFINNWVRPGQLKLTYHSLKTDTADEGTFFRQEVAALAAGKQNQMWNFALTFLYEQESGLTGYATNEFLTGIADQMPALNRDRWRDDWDEPSLMKQVALGVRLAHARSFRYTPSFLVRIADGKADSISPGIRKEFLASLDESIAGMRAEALNDTPTFGGIIP